MKLIIIVIALVIALVVAFGVSTFVNEKKPAPQVQVLSTAPTAAQTAPKPVRTEVYVAARDLPIGTVLTANDYTSLSLNQQLLPPGAIPYGGKDAPNLDGMITRTSIQKDQPLLTSQLRNPNDPTYIAGQLGEGMRAITIPVNMTSSIAGFVTPGDKVDVLFTFELIKSAVQGGDVTGTKAGGNDRNLNFTEILLPNVKILAVDTRVTAEAPAPKDGNNAPPPMPTSVTLEVNQRDAQKLKLAQKMGDLSLLIRSVKDRDSYELVRPTAEQDLTRILPPAYFPVLFDSDATYDFGVVDLYGSTLSQASRQNAGVITIDPKTGRMTKKGGESGLPETGVNASEGDAKTPQMSVNVYRGVQLEKVEVNKP